MVREKVIKDMGWDQVMAMEKQKNEEPLVYSKMATIAPSKKSRRRAKINERKLKNKEPSVFSEIIKHKEKEKLAIAIAEGGLYKEVYEVRGDVIDELKKEAKEVKDFHQRLNPTIREIWEFFYSKGNLDNYQFPNRLIVVTQTVVDAKRLLEEIMFFFNDVLVKRDSDFRIKLTK